MPKSNFEKEMEKLEREGVISRSQFLQIMAAAGAFLALGTNKVYAAKSNAKAKIVIIGGGAAGISMAAQLLRKLANPDITIIDPSERQYYQPGFTLIAGGVYGADDVWKPQAECMPDGVKWIKDKVTLVHPTQNKIDTAKSGTIGYDFLVVAPGVKYDWSRIEGITYKTIGAGNAHTIYDHRGAQMTWQAMQEFSKQGGKGVFCDTWTKHKCGGAPKKVSLLTWDNCRMQGTAEYADIHYYTASKQLYNVPHFTPRLEEIYRERNIPVDVNCRLKGIDTEAKRAHFERVETDAEGNKTTTPFTESYDFMHFMVPQCAPDFVRESGLSWTEGSLAADGWVMVDKHSLGPDVSSNNISQRIQARVGVKIQAEQDISLGQKSLDTLGVVLIDNHITDAAHPIQIVGVFVGDHTLNIVPLVAQSLGPRDRRADSIAIGIGVREDYHILGLALDHATQDVQILLR
jgi:sulfide:quinone oxidoreductase